MAEDASNMAEILLYYIEANKEDLTIYEIKTLFKHIRKCLDKIHWAFVKKENSIEGED